VRRPARPALKRWQKILLVAAVPLSVLILAVLGIRHFFFTEGTPPAPADKAAEAQAAVPPAPALPPPLQEEKIIIPRGTSLARLLKVRGFDNREIHRLKESVKPVYDLARITAGHEMRLFKTPAGIWKTLEYDIDETRYLAVRKESEGVSAEVKYYPYEIRPALVFGVIETSPVAAMAKAGEDNALAYDLAERCFGWDIDFYTDLRKGDAFRILVEKKFLDGTFTGYRNILAAEFTNDGKVFQAFRYTYPDSGVADYFDEEGLSKRKEFLKSPFKYGAHVTSRFSGSRLHPIYKVYRPHYGVDYGAPVGTQVQATADGKVTFAGWDGASGRKVRIQHKNSYETTYLHLSSFGPGIRSGAQVKGGDIVGYVGSTGDATGPHLDYRVSYHGSPINPLGQKFKPADPVRKEFRDGYKEEARRLLMVLDAPRILRTSLMLLSF
jgi:murein DD-endopeptidase MepM/ murein hydrolase activator NlpD